MNDIYKKKIVMIGEGAVGKTSLIRKCVYNEFSETYISTIGTVVSKTSVELPDKTIQLEIWDVAGQTMHHPDLNLRHYSGAKGAIAVFDTTRFDTLVSQKINPITQQQEFFGIYRYIKDLFNITGEIPVALVGNKYDLIQNFKIYLDLNPEDVKNPENEGVKKRFKCFMEDLNRKVLEFYEINYPAEFEEITFYPVLESDIKTHEAIIRKKLGMENSMPYFVSSAKNGMNVKNVFKTLAELLTED